MSAEREASQRETQIAFLLSVSTYIVSPAGSPVSAVFSLLPFVWTALYIQHDLYCIYISHLWYNPAQPGLWGERWRLSTLLKGQQHWTCANQWSHAEWLLVASLHVFKATYVPQITQDVAEPWLLLLCLNRRWSMCSNCTWTHISVLDGDIITLSLSCLCVFDLMWWLESVLISLKWLHLKFISQSSCVSYCLFGLKCLSV